MSNAKKPHVDVDRHAHLVEAQTSLDDACHTARRAKALAAFLGHATETGFETDPEDLGLVGDMIVELADDIRSDIHAAQEQIFLMSDPDATPADAAVAVR